MPESDKKGIVVSIPPALGGGWTKPINWMSWPDATSASVGYQGALNIYEDDTKVGQFNKDAWVCWVNCDHNVMDALMDRLKINNDPKG